MDKLDELRSKVLEQVEEVLRTSSLASDEAIFSSYCILGKYVKIIKNIENLKTDLMHDFTHSAQYDSVKR